MRWCGHRQIEGAARLKKPILFVTLCLDFGGAERHLSTIMPALARRGWPVSVYCTNRLGAFADTVRRGGVEVIGPPIEATPGTTGRGLRLAYAALASARLLRVMRRLRPEIVHFFLPEPYMLGAPLALLRRIPIRIMSRRSLNLYQSQWPGVRWIEEHLHPHMTAILGNSKRVVDELLEEGCDPSRVGLIYNGVALDRFRKQIDQRQVRRSLGIAANAFVISVVANLVPRKRHSDILDAVSRAAPRLPAPWTLVCVGRDDGCLADIKAQAARLGIASNVLLLGERSDVAEILQASDMGVLASMEEGFSNALLELMAVGLPVVVTDVGGNSEAVVDGHNGLVVPPCRPHALAEAIVKVASNRAWAAGLGAAGRRRVENLFNLQTCVDRYEALYEGLLAGQRVSDVPAVLAEQHESVSVAGP